MVILDWHYSVAEKRDLMNIFVYSHFDWRSVGKPELSCTSARTESLQFTAFFICSLHHSVSQTHSLTLLIDSFRTRVLWTLIVLEKENWRFQNWAIISHRHHQDLGRNEAPSPRSFRWLATCLSFYQSVRASRINPSAVSTVQQRRGPGGDATPAIITSSDNSPDTIRQSVKPFYDTRSPPTRPAR